MTRATGLSRGLLGLAVLMLGLSLIGAVALWQQEHAVVCITALVQAALFLCFYPVAAAIYLTGAATYLYFASWPPTVVEATVLYAPFLLLLIGEALWRRFPTRIIGNERAATA